MSFDTTIVQRYESLVQILEPIDHFLISWPMYRVSTLISFIIEQGDKK